MGDNIGQTIGIVGFSVAGAYMGGWTGMQIGMSIGYFLFSPKEKSNYESNDSVVKATVNKSKPDVVPCVIGTDMSSGTVVWLNYAQMVDGDITHVLANNDSIRTWIRSDFSTSISFNGFMFYDDWLMEKYLYDEKLPFVEFYIVFNGEYFGYGSSTNRFYINNYDTWEMFRILDAYWSYLTYWEVNQWEDQLGNYAGANRIFLYLNNYSDFVSRNLIPELPYLEYNLKNSNYSTLTGIFSMPKSKALDEKSNALAAVSYGHDLRVTPNFTAEIRGENSPYPRLSFRGANSDYYYSYNSSWRNEKFSFKDLFSDYIYGLSYSSNDYGYIIPYAINTYYYNKTDEPRNLYYEVPGVETYSMPAPYYVLSNDYLDYFREHIARTGPNMKFLSRQWGDRLYFFVCRNWKDGGTTQHHHANYSLEYDIFYIDRSTGGHGTLVSLVHDDQINISASTYNGPGSKIEARPSFHAMSMEVLHDEIWVFGYEPEANFLLKEYRTVKSVDQNNSRKIYIDLSVYPDGYWVGDWASAYRYDSQGATRDIFDYIKITAQTKTYIIVERNYFCPVHEGTGIQLSKVRYEQAEPAIVGEGSTRTHIICSRPGKNTIDMEYWAYVYLPDSLTLHVITDPEDSGSIVKLTGTGQALTRDPIPGETIMFVAGGTLEPIAHPPNFASGDEHITNPRLPDFEPFTQRFHHLCPEDYPVLKPYNYYMCDRQYAKCTILKFSAIDGSYIEKVVGWDLISRFAYRWAGVTVHWTIELANISTCRTDNQIYFAFTFAQNYSELGMIGGVINISGPGNYSIEKRDERRNKGASSWACGTVYRETVKVREWNPLLSHYQDIWYALAIQYDSNCGNIGGGMKTVYI